MARSSQTPVVNPSLRSEDVVLPTSTGRTVHKQRRCARPPRRWWLHSTMALFASLALTAALRTPTIAQTNWVGGAGGGNYWDIGTNWLGGSTPGLGSNVVNNTSSSLTYRQGTNTVNSFLNSSSGSFYLTGGTLNTTSTFTDSGSGSINIQSGTLDVGTNFVDSGTGAINVSGGILNILGSFLNTGSGTVTFTGGTTSVGSNFTSNGSVYLNGGTLSGTSAALSNLQVNNTFQINGGTLKNFTVNAGSGSGASVVFSGTSTLDGTVFNAGINLSAGATVNVLNNLTATGGGSFNSSTVVYQTSGHLAGGSFSMSGGYLGATETNALTIDSGTTIHGSGSGYVGAYNNSLYGGNLVNNGTLTADVNSSNLYVQPGRSPGSSVYGTFTNTGTLSALSGGTLYVAPNGTSGGTIGGNILASGAGSRIQLGGTETLADGTTFASSNGGKIYLYAGSTYDNQGHTINLIDGALSFGSGTLKNSTINVSGTGTGLDFTNGSGYLNNVSTNGTFNISGGNSAYISNNFTATGGGSFTGSNLIYQTSGHLAGGSFSMSGGFLGATETNTLTIDSGTTIHGSSSGYIGTYNGSLYGGNLVNNGTLTADVNSSNLYVQPGRSPGSSVYGTFTNTGTLSALNGGTLYVASNGTTGGTIGGNILASGAGSRIQLGGTETLADGTTFASSNGGKVYLYAGSTYDNQGHTINLIDGALSFGSGTLKNSTINVSGTGTGLDFTTGSGYLNNVSTNGTLNISGGNTVYVSNNLTATGGGSFNASNIVYQTSGHLAGGSFSMSGGYLGATETNTLTIDSGTTIHGGGSGYVGAYNNSLYGGNLVNNGTLSADVNSSNLYVQPGRNPGSSVYGTFTNTGTLSALNGGTLYVASNGTTGGTIANTGTILAGTGSAVIFGVNVSQTAGKTQADGTLNLNSNTLTVAGGTLTGGGRVSGNVSNTGGTLDLSGAAQNLNITGNYTQAASAAMSLLLGNSAATSSYLTINGYATLAGTFNLNLASGFQGDPGNVFNLLTASGGHANSLFSTTGSNITGFSYSLGWSGNTLQAMVLYVPGSNYYLNTADGTWSKGTNWSLGTAPAASDNVVNDSTKTLTFNSGSATINSFRGTAEFDLLGGSLNLSGGNTGQQGNLQVSNTFQLNNATINNATILAGTGGQGVTVGSGTSTLSNVISNANLSMTGGGTLNLTGTTLNGTNTLTNVNLNLSGSNTIANGNLVWNGASAQNVMFDYSKATSLTIGSGTTLSGNIGQIGYDSYANRPVHSLTNNGTISSTTSGTTTYLFLNQLANNGLIEAKNGANLSIYSSGSNIATPSLVNNAGGTIQVLNGGTLSFVSDTFTNNGTLSAVGSTVALNSATLTNNATANNIGTLTLNSSTLNGTGTLTATNVNVIGNSYLSGTETLKGTTATLSASNLYLQNGATLGVGTINLNNGSTLQISGTPSLTTTQFNFNGTASNLQFDPSAATSLTIGSGTTLSGNIGQIGYDSYANRPVHSLTNNGTISSTTSGTTTSLYFNQLANNGLIEAKNGANLSIYSSGSNIATPSLVNNAGGTIQVLNGGMLSFVSDTFTNKGTLNVNASTLYLNGATLIANSALNLTNSSNLSLNSGTLTNNSSAINVNNLTLTSGTLNGSGTTNVAGMITATGSSYLSGSATLNASSMTLSASNLYVQNGATLGVGTVNLNNGSMLQISGSPSVTTTQFNFNGTASSLQFDPSSATSLTIGSGTTLSGNIGQIGYDSYANRPVHSLTNNGTISSTTSGTTTYLFLNQLANNGLIEARNGANLSIYSSGANSATPSLVNNAGGTIQVLNGGTLNINGVSFNNKGTLTGGGTIANGLTNSGTLNPGSGTTGTLNISNGFTQTSTGNLGIEIAGSTKGSTFDWLNITGNVSLGGYVNVSLLSNFTPVLNNEFEFLDYSGTLTGTFAGVHSNDVGYGYSLDYQTGKIYIKVTQSLIDQWVKAGNGNWTEATAWSSNPSLPGPTNNVLNTSNYTITHNSGNDTIGNFTSTGEFDLTGGSLTASQIQVNNTFQLNNATINNATILAGTGGQGVTVGSGTSTLSSVISNANLTMTGGGTLNLTGTTLNGTNSLTNVNLNLSGSNTIAKGSLVWNGASAQNIAFNSSTATSLTLGATTNLSGNIGQIGVVGASSAVATLINNGTINSNVNGNTTSLYLNQFTNNGTLQATGGANLALYGSGSSSATPSFTNSATGTLSVANGGTLSLNNLTLTNNGTLSAVGSTLALNSATLTNNATANSIGTLALTNSTLNGTGTLTATNVNISGTSTLSGTETLNGGTATLSGSQLNVTSGANLGVGTVNLNNGSTLLLSGSPTLTSTQLTFGNTGGSTTASNLAFDTATTTSLTLSAGTTLSGNIGTIGHLVSSGTGATLTNNGLIDSTLNGNTTTVQLTQLNNNGTFKAENGANLTLQGGSATNAGTLSVGNGGTLLLSSNALTSTGSVTASNLTLTGSTLTESAGSVSVTNLLSLTNSTLTNTGGTLGTANLTLNNSSLTNTASGSLALTSLGLTNSTLTNGSYNASSLTLSGNNLLNRTTLTTSSVDLTGGQTLRLQNATLNASGGIALDNGANLVLIGTNPPITLNTSTISFGNNGASSRLLLEDNTIYTIGNSQTLSGRIGQIGGGYSTSGNNSNVNNNGTINASGSLTIAATVFAEGATGSLTTGAGGTLTLSGTTFTNNGGTLSASNLAVSGSALRKGALTTANSATFTGTSSIDGVNLTAANVTLNGGTLTTSSSYGAATLNATNLNLNNGASLRIVTAPTFNVTNFVFGGSASNLYLENGASFTLASGQTLSGTVGNLGGGSTTAGTGTSLTNNGTITLGTSGNTTTIGSASFTNNGSLEVQNGATLRVNPLLSNAGSLTIDAGGTLNTAGNLTQTAGTTTLNGTLNLNSGAGTFSLNGGALTETGTKTLTGNLSNAGTVQLGTAPGVLNVTGNYTQASGGVLNLAVNGYTAGSQFSQLLVGGSSTLGGTLDLIFSSSLHPYTGDSFELVDYASHTGQFSTLTSNNGTVYSLDYQSNKIVSTITQTAYGVYWTKGSNGDWSQGSGWNKAGVTGNLPTSTDDVVNNTANTITHSTGSDTVASLYSKGALDLTGGVLDVTGTVQVKNTLTIDGGTLKDATLQSGGMGSSLQFTQNTNNVFNNVKLGSGVGLDLSNGGTTGGYLRIDNGLTAGGNTITLNDSARIGFDGTQTFGNATVNFGNSGVNTLSAEGNGTLTLGGGLTLTGSNMHLTTNVLNGTGATLDNATTLTAGSGQTLLIDGNKFVNDGTLTATGTGVINVNAANYGHIGQVSASGNGIVNLMGGTIYYNSATDFFSTSGNGQIDLKTTLDLGHGAIDASQLNVLTLSGATVSNGTVNNSNLLHFAAGNSNLFNNISFSGGLDLTSGGQVAFTGGLSTASGVINLNNAARLLFTGNQTVQNANINFGNSSNEGNSNNVASWNLMSVEGGGTLHLGNNVALTGSYAYLTSDTLGSTHSTIQNDGTFSANSGQNILVFPDTLVNSAGAVMQANAGGTLRIDPNHLDNYGTLAANNGGQLTVGPTNWDHVGVLQSNGAGSVVTLAGGTITFDSYAAGTPHPNLQAINGGQFVLSTNVNNAGQFFNVVDTGGIFTVKNGGFTGGQLNTSSLLLRFAANADNVLDNVTLTTLDPTKLSGLDLSNGGWAHIKDTITSNNVYTLDGGAHLTFDGSRNFGTLDAAIGPGGSIVPGQASTFAVGTGTINVTDAGSTLLFGQGASVTGNSLTINADTLTNRITLGAVNNGTWTINANTLNNTAFAGVAPDIRAGIGSTMTLNVGTFNNVTADGTTASTVEARDNGTLILNVANYNRIGIIQSVGTGSRTFLNGGGTAGLTLGSQDYLRAYDGGTNIITGTLHNEATTATNGFINLDDITAHVSGGLEFAGGHLSGGALNSESPYLSFAGSAYGDTLLDNVKLVGYDGTTLAGLNLNNGGWVHVINAPTTAWSNYQFQLDSGAHLTFDGDSVTNTVTFSSATGNAAHATFGDGGGEIIGHANANITLGAGTVFTGITHTDGSLGGNYSFQMGTGALELDSGAVVDGKYVGVNGGTLNNNIDLSSHAGGAWSVNNTTLVNNGILDAQKASGFTITTNTLTNSGNLTAETGGALSVTASNFTNTGLVSATAGGAIALNAATYGRLGTVMADGFNNTGGATYDANNRAQHSSVALAGNLNLTSLDSVHATNGADIYLGQGAYGAPGGYLTNTGKFLNVDDSSSGGRISVSGAGNFILNGGHIEGGTLNSTSSHLKFNNVYSNGGQYDNTLSNVTLTDSTGSTSSAHLAGLDLSAGGSVTLQNSFTSNNQFNLGNGARLSFGSNATNSWTFGSNTNFNFGSGTGGTIDAYGTTLTLNNTTVTGTNATIGDWSQGQPTNKLVNNTTLSSNQGGTWVIRPHELDNSGGIIEAVGGNGSVVSLQASVYTGGNLGKVEAIGDNVSGHNQADVILGGTGQINATGTLSFEAHGLGKISLQTVLDMGGTGVFGSGGTLDAANLGSPLTYANGPDKGGYFELSNGTLQNGNVIIDTLDPRLSFALATHNVLKNMVLLAASGPSPYAGLNLTVGSSIRVEGYFGSNNQFDLDRGGSVSFDGDRTFSSGALTVGNHARTDGATGGSFSVDGILTLNSGFTVTGQQVNLSAGTLNNNITLSSQTAGGNWNVSAGTLNNAGTIQAIAGSALSLTASGLLTNTGTVQASGGSSLTLSAGSLDNSGHTIQALSGSTVTANGGNWVHVGQLNASGANSVLNIGGTFSMGSGDSIVAQSGGKTVLQGTLNLGTQFLSPTLAANDPLNTSHISGNFEVNGGRINSGIINTDDSALHLVNATLDNVTLENISGAQIGLNMTHGENIMLLDGLNSKPQFALDNNATLTFGTHSGAWVYGAGSAFNFGTVGATVDIQSGQTLDLAAGASVTGNNMVFGRQYEGVNSGNLIIGTTLNANNTNLLISTNSLTNTGLIEATNGGHAILGAASYGQVGHLVVDGTGSTMDLGHWGFWPYQTGGPLTLQAGDLLEAKNGGTFSLQTTMNATGLQLLTNSGASVTSDGTGSFQFNGGRLNGGILNSTSSALSFSQNIPYYAGVSGQDNVLNGVTLTTGDGHTLAGLNLTNGGWAHLMSNVVSNNTFDLDNNAHLVLDGNRTFGGNGTSATFDFHTGAGGTVYLTGGSLVTLNDGVVLSGKNATIGAASPYAGGSTTLINTTTIASNQGGTWTLNPNILENDGTLSADNHSTLTLGASGGGLVTNNSAITATNGSTLNFNAATMLNNGSISVDHSSVNVNSSNLTNAFNNTMTLANSSLTLNNSQFTTKGQLDFSGSTSLVLNQSTFNNDGHAPTDLLHGYPVTVGNLTLNGSTINDGYLTATGAVTVTSNNHNLINNASFTIAGANNLLDLSQGGYLRFNNGVLTTNRIELNNGGTLDLSGTPLLNVGTIHFGATGSNGLFFENGAAVTFGLNTTLTGNIGTIGGTGTFTNTGTISPDGAGVNAQIKSDTFNNQGNVVLSNAANLTVQSSKVTTNGSITINGGSNLTVASGLTEGAGFVTVNGVLTMAPNTELLVTGGSVKGSGQIGGDIDLSGGSIDPGNSPGHLTVTGNTTFGSGSALNIQLAGTDPGVTFDWLDVGGVAKLSGDLNFSLYGGYLPTTAGETDYTFLTAVGGIQGTFDQITFAGLTGYDYQVHYGPNSVYLALEAQHPTVPEPGPLALLVGSLTGIGWLASRRKSRAA